ncbi:MAG TPA: hypothetical protein VGF50_03345 [Caulobacteraceae bacterium]
MSGLFADLAARAHGDAQAVRPRLPARFETSAQDPLVELTVETPATAPTYDQPDRTPAERSVETTAAPDAAPPRAGEPAVPRAEPSATPRPPAAQRSAPIAAPAEAHAQVERARPGAEAPTARAESDDVHAAAPLSPRVALREPEVAAPAPQRPRAAAENRATTLERAPEPPRLIAPRLTPARAETAQPRPAPDREETTVHVSIGRIELRAAQNAPPPAARPREAARSAVMSLEDYLQSRRARR